MAQCLLWKNVCACLNRELSESERGCFSEVVYDVGEENECTSPVAISSARTDSMLRTYSALSLRVMQSRRLTFASSSTPSRKAGYVGSYFALGRG